MLQIHVYDDFHCFPKKRKCFRYTCRTIFFFFHSFKYTYRTIFTFFFKSVDVSDFPKKRKCFRYTCRTIFFFTASNTRIGRFSLFFQKRRCLRYMCRTIFTLISQNVDASDTQIRRFSICFPHGEANPSERPN